MPILFQLIRYAPAPREWKVEWRRMLLDRSYAKDIAATRAAKDEEKARSLEHDHQYEAQLNEEEDDLQLTRYLVRQARRLHVPVPRFKNVDGSESDHWHEGPLTYQRLLTTPLRQNSCRLLTIGSWGGDKGQKWQGTDRNSWTEQ